MLIGAMNHPGRTLAGEIEWMAAMGLDFIDLTLEPPLAAVWNVDVGSVRAMLEKRGLRVIGHTAYYLPFGSPFESIRLAAVEEAKRCIAAFAAVGAPWMNLHPDWHAPLHDTNYVIERNLQSVRELSATARNEGLGLMLENLPGDLSTVSLLGKLLDPLPDVGLHLDIGHANLMVPWNTTEDILSVYGHRLRHVHLHDNKGGSADLHLPLGAGTLDFPRHIRALKASGYNDTITLEVFTTDRQYVSYSRDVLRRIWDESPPPAPAPSASA